MSDFKLIEKWVDVNSQEGQRLLTCPRPDAAVFDPDDHPHFDPLYWNTKQKGANCMAYALDAPNEAMNPGEVPGKTTRQLAELFNRAHEGDGMLSMDAFKSGVYVGLDRDGLILADPEELYRPGHYLIALCFCEKPELVRKDFHFLRQDQGGNWSQINGLGQSVSWTDGHDELISNPAMAFLGHGTQFDRFYHVPKGGAKALRKLKVA